MSRASVAGAAAAAVVLAVAGSGCRDTVDRANAKRQLGTEVAKNAPDLKVTQNKSLKITVEGILADDNNTAVVVSIRNTDTKRAVVWAPVSVNLTNEAGKVVATNTAGGNDVSLTRFPSLPAGGEAFYVNDTFDPGLGATGAKVKLGGTLVALPEKLDPLRVDNVKVDLEAASFSGTVVNTSNVEQPILIVQAIARRGTKVVAAGTGIVRTPLAPGASAPFTGFLIGTVGSAKVQVTAPVTNTAEGGSAKDPAVAAAVAAAATPGVPAPGPPAAP